MIVYTDPNTGNICQCSKSSSVPDGVPWREVPSYEGRKHRNALIDFDVDGAPVYDDIQVNHNLIEEEAVKRMNALYSIIKNKNDVEFFAVLWRSINPQARQPTIEFQQLIDIYQTAEQAIANNTPFDQIVWP